MKTEMCYSGGDCSGCNSSRSFLTKEEKIKMLKEYQADLEKEAQGVTERIAQLEEE